MFGRRRRQWSRVALSRRQELFTLADIARSVTEVCQRPKSIHALRHREFPCAVEGFGARAIEPHHVIPAWHSRQAIRNRAVAAAELNGDQAVRIYLGGD